MSRIRRSLPLVSVILITILVLQSVPSSVLASAITSVRSFVDGASLSFAPPLKDSGASDQRIQGIASDSTPRSPYDSRVQSKAKPPKPEEPVSVDVQPDQNTVLHSARGEVNVSFPAGAVAETVKVTYTPMPQETSGVMRFFKVFKLEASAISDASSVSKFGKNLGINLTYTDQDVAGLDVGSMALYYYDDAKVEWVAVPSSLDQSSHTLTAVTDHFTIYGGGAVPVYSVPGVVMDFQDGLTSGAATTAYPIDLPSGPGGFRPNLVLSYSSGVVDEMKNNRDVGSWVGMGWTLNPGRIFYNEDEARYFLELNGISYQLVQGSDGVYRTFDDQYWKITKTGDKFEMWDCDGNYYRFGQNTDAIQYRGSTKYRYDLSLIQDVHGNQMTVAYARDIRNGTVRSAYPVDIYYGVSAAINVHFNSSFDITGDQTDGNLRNDNPKSYGSYPAPQVMENKKLDSIEVKVSGSQVRKYVFSYTTTNTYLSGGKYLAGTHTLTSITQYGTDTTSLPAMTFSYQNKYTRYYNSAGTASSALNWPHLYQIGTGFGGTISNTYSESPSGTASNTWTREVLVQQDVDSGIGPVQITKYLYVGYPNTGEYGNSPESNLDWHGFSEVQEVDAANNMVKHFFSGQREWQTQWLEKGTVVNSSVANWISDYDSSEYVYHTRLDNAGSTDGNKTSRTYYQYDSYGNVIREKRMGDIDATGDEATVFSTFYPNTSAWIVDRVARERTYSDALDTDPGTGWESQSLYYYDGHNSDSTAQPTKGDVTRVESYASSSSSINQYRTYDSYGNVATEQDANGNTISYTMDSTYQTYATVKTLPAIGGSSMHEDYTWDYVLGQQLSVSDFNGETTSYAYDALGRKTKEIHPGDSSNDPTIGYTYVSWGTINSQCVKTEQKLGGNRNPLWTKSYFDGLQRDIQTQALAEDGKSIVSSTTSYNNRGSLDRTYDPWLLSSEQTTYQTPGGSVKYTSFEYDILSRRTLRSSPDGTTMGTDYMSPWAQVTTTEKGAKTSNQNDAYGQLAQAKEYDLAPAYSSSFGSGLSGPQGMAAIRGGLVYLADTGNHRIQKYSSQGSLVASVGSYGSGNEQFSSPYDVAVTGDGRQYYVADSGNNRIDQWSNEIYFLLQFGSFGTANGQLAYPWAVATNNGGTYAYVADMYNHRIERFNASTGAYSTKWGTYGTGNGQFSYPQGAAVDGSGYVYVADAGNDRIQKFGPTGSYVTKWGTSGSGNGQFYGPSAVAYGNAHVYVVDSGNSRVQYFSAGGAYQGQWGSNGTGNGQFSNPSGIAVAPDGSVYVADTDNHRIQKFDSTGTFSAAWGSYGGSDGQFMYLRSVAVGGDGKVYVADDTSRIQVFDSSGNFVEKWGSPGVEPGQTNGVGIAFDRTNNKVFVVDGSNHRVQKFEAGTKVVRKWGTSGSGNGQFNGPKGVSLDDAGNLYVADTGNNRIQKFDSAGTYLTKWGTSGTGNGQFNSPYGVAVDFNGNVYVADTSNHRIQKFDTSGNFVLTWGSSGSGNGQFSSPSRVAVDGAGYVYVSDPGNNRVQKFTPDGTFLLSWNSGSGSLNAPKGIAIGGDGLSDLYVADSGNNRVVHFDGMGTLYSTTSYTYDVLRNMLTATDDGSNTITNGYDKLSRKTSMSDPDMGSWSYQYDSNGNMTQQTDAKSQVLTFEFDALGRMTAKKNGGTTLASYTYDDITGGNFGKGRRTGMTDSVGTMSYTYDSRGRTIKEDRVVDGTTYTTQYGYDSADRLTSTTYPTTEVVTQNYTDRGLPSWVSGSVAGTLAGGASYNQFGQLTQVDLGNGLRTVYNYHGLDTVDTGDANSYYDKLYRIKVYKTSDGSVRMHQKYWWDAAGDVSSREDEVASVTENFTYDFLNRLTAAAATGVYGESYSYNAIGNMTSKNNTNYTYGTKPHAVTGVGSYSNGYDANGNMTTRQNSIGSQTLTWNVENLLSQVDGTGGGYSGTTTYVYDGDGRRIKKTEGGETVVYVNEYYEENVTTSVVTSNYYLGGNEVAIKKGSTIEYLHQDSAGSTSLSTYSSGAQASSTTYYPFGATRSSSGSLGTSMMFTAQQMDSGADLYFDGTSYYDQGVARLLGASGLSSEVGAAPGFDAYSRQPSTTGIISLHGSWWYRFSVWAPAIIARPPRGISKPGRISATGEVNLIWDVTITSGKTLPYSLVWYSFNFNCGYDSGAGENDKISAAAVITDQKDKTLQRIALRLSTKSPGGFIPPHRSWLVGSATGTVKVPKGKTYYSKVTFSSSGSEGNPWQRIHAVIPGAFRVNLLNGYLEM